MFGITELFCCKTFWIFTTFVVCLYLYLKFVVYDVWNRIKVPHDAPTVLLGNINSNFITGKVTIGDMVKEYYDKYRKQRFFGMYIFHNPILVINDPELIRSILVKDFQYFYDRGIHSNLKIDPMSYNLFRLPGKRWKHLRTKLSPIFTSGKLKQLYPLLLEVSDELIDICNTSFEQCDVMDVKDLVERFITDCISTIAFGFNCNSLKNPNNEFRLQGQAGTDIGKYTAVMSIFGSNILDFLSSPVFKGSVNKFFVKLFEDVVSQRVKDKVVRNDFINMLMDLTNYEHSDNREIRKEEELSPDDKLNVLEAAAQVFVFFIAGFETTSTTLTYCLHELAKYPEVQEKLQQEIDEIVNTPEGFSYENVMNMRYLDMVFCEALRKHPAVPFINRLCTQDYVIPDTDVRIPKGMRLAISVNGLQNDPDIYPEPERFDPARFSKESLAERNSYYFLPFGEGPRICIAKRIAFMQGKIGLATLLWKFKVSICEETPMPLPYSNRTFLLVTDSPLYLKVSKR